MDTKLEVGRMHILTRMVTKELSADACGNPGVFVLSTPFLVNLIEIAAHECILPGLKQGESSVGTKVNVEHLAATPIGMEVVVDVELVQMDKNRLLFKVGAHDAKDQVASGTHERYLVKSLQRFLARTESKLSKS